MKPAPFEYFAPTDMTEALDLLSHYGGEAKILAGGQSLMPLMNMRLARPSVLIDINRLAALSHISLDANGALAIGALTRQRTIERDSLIQTHYPLLAAVMPSLGHFQIRNRGTIGGSIVHADPAAELPALCLALEAEFVLRSAGGQRTINAEDFFRTDLDGAITIETRCADGMAVVSIADTGSGIAPDVIGRIFDPFFTTKTVGEGTGLGLSISYEIVKKHGGEIRAESPPGGGAVFTVRLPIARKAQA